MGRGRKETHDRHRANELDPLGVRRHDDDRLLLVLPRRSVGLAHDEVHGVARVAGARDPPLAAGDDDLVAFEADGGLDVGCTEVRWKWWREEGAFLSFGNGAGGEEGGRRGRRGGRTRSSRRPFRSWRRKNEFSRPGEAAATFSSGPLCRTEREPLKTLRRQLPGCEAGRRQAKKREPMLPVSGAEQLHASEAIKERPINSAITASAKKRLEVSVRRPPPLPRNPAGLAHTQGS